MPNATLDAFDNFWDGYWKPTQFPAVFDAAMREIAVNAWNAALKAADDKIYRSYKLDGQMNRADYSAQVLSIRAV